MISGGPSQSLIKGSKLLFFCKTRLIVLYPYVQLLSLLIRIAVKISSVHSNLAQVWIGFSLLGKLCMASALHEFCSNKLHIVLVVTVFLLEVNI